MKREILRLQKTVVKLFLLDSASNHDETEPPTIYALIDV